MRLRYLCWCSRRSIRIGEACQDIKWSRLMPPMRVGINDEADGSPDQRKRIDPMTDGAYSVGGKVRKVCQDLDLRHLEDFLFPVIYFFSLVKFWWDDIQVHVLQKRILAPSVIRNGNGDVSYAETTEIKVTAVCRTWLGALFRVTDEIVADADWGDAIIDTGHWTPESFVLLSWFVNTGIV